MNFENKNREQRESRLTYFIQNGNKPISIVVVQKWYNFVVDCLISGLCSLYEYFFYEYDMRVLLGNPVWVFAQFFYLFYVRRRSRETTDLSLFT